MKLHHTNMSVINKQQGNLSEKRSEDEFYKKS